jgi:SAM-dependent methyltransferase
MKNLREPPWARYKKELLNFISQSLPQSLLDVGCGNGNLLRAAAAPGRRCVGIEIEAEHVAALRRDGLEIQLGRAEQLAFDDRSFDLVVFDYTAHHLDNLDRALLEAARVARRGRWSSLIRGMIFRFRRRGSRTILTCGHSGSIEGWAWSTAPALSAAQLTRPFSALGGFLMEFRYQLVLAAASLEAWTERARGRLTQSNGLDDLELELRAILDRARLEGVGEGGAVLFTAARTDG